MNKRKLLKNISYGFVANVVSMAVGALSVLIIPKFIGVEAFGYYQLYLFYVGYVTITALGLPDGNYLKIGGRNFSDLDYPSQSNQFWLLVISQVFAYILLAIGTTQVSDGDKRWILLVTCVCALVINARYYLYLTLQATERVKEYAVIVITERIISVICSILLVMAGYSDYKALVVLDVIGRAISLVIAFWYCRDYVFLKPNITWETIRNATDTIKAGAMVLFSSLSGTMIVGVSRFGIENHWGIETFSKVSLTISLSNMASRCINAVGIAMFPALRNTKKDELPRIYRKLNDLLMTMVFLGLAFYQPFAELLKLWLPNYADSIKYAAILLPVCAYECKNVMIVSTYLKALRQERILLFSNMAALVFSGLGTILTVYGMQNLEFAIVTILIALILRCAIGEVCIGSLLHIRIAKDMILEIVMVFAFVFSNWYLKGIGFWVYAVFAAAYLYAKRGIIGQLKRVVR